ncbi:glycoside hydrolase family 13 protein [Paenibacillus sp. J5C_2022]|uniref:glycoside hydrolase family 13 protein n=1 Tax=Paenibacillus sp. J5C2022 TaxID=2977129 RepID=UPI0021CF2F44|nr:glycoside hydrolase family 13 protein [Paenibacillus sp. J5C2022]MCU6712892.1 glycoside hydrolase family 13 protein [Paenibacillus sp. J5C2022]
MLLEAIYHRSTDSYCYAYDDRTVHIRLRTRKGDLESIKAVYGDKYDWAGTGTEKAMRIIASDELFDYWQAELTPPYGRLRYAFQLIDGEQQLWYTEQGFTTHRPQDPLTFFDYPFIWPSEVLAPPAWVREAVFYQIFTERFANGDVSNDPLGVRSWEEDNPGPHDYYGGDLQGVLDNVDYIQSLGVNAVYFTPLFEAHTNHKYDTADYYRIDRHFGDVSLMKKVVEAFHERGIRVVLDAVFNHSGKAFAPFRDVLDKGRASVYWDWFLMHDDQLAAGDRPNYHCFAFEAHMPKLNTANLKVRDYLLGVARYWIEECDIDGWRLDVANEVDHSFWREFRQSVKSLKPDFYILGEIWHDAMPWLRGDQFDAVMNYPVTEAILQFSAGGEIDAPTLSSRISRILVNYPQQVNEAAFNIIGSHDTPRVLTQTGDARKLMLAALLQFTLPGTPCIYYGDEIGMTGGADPDCRKPMIWDEARQDAELLGFYRRLIEWRKTYETLQAGACEFVYAHHRQLVVCRASASERIYIALNDEDTEQAITFAAEPVASYRALGGSGTFRMADSTMTVGLPPFGWIVLVAEPPEGA